VPNVTSVAFVGTGLDRLLITTRDGGLFLADVGAVGLPVPYWEGPPCAPS
jgi:sugar lactone lactonase YvrE